MLLDAGFQKDGKFRPWAFVNGGVCLVDADLSELRQHD